MKKLRNISIILLIISAIVMINATWAWFDDFLHPNNWLHGLGMLVGGVLFALFLLACQQEQSAKRQKTLDNN